MVGVAEVQGYVAAPVDVAWAVLADGWGYASWVVGTTKIRSVEREWPAEGARLHHAVGSWPLVLKDETEVLVCEPGERLRMQARGWPVGEATIEIRLSPHRVGTFVRMDERPSAGPGRWVNNPLAELGLRWRLTETLDRFSRLAAGRAGRLVPPG